MNNYNLIQNISIWAVPVLLGIIVHEVAHGFVAKKLGDKTAFLMGRLTLNPIAHIDLFGTIILPLICLYLNTFIFGWAKPVPVNYRNLRDRKFGPALVALAGPGANLILAISWAGLTKIFQLTLLNSNINQSKSFILSMGFAGIYFNIFLMLLNLIPIPPLDGSRILSSFLPVRINEFYGKIENYGFIILIILLYTNILPTILHPVLKFSMNFLCAIFNI